MFQLMRGRCAFAAKLVLSVVALSTVLTSPVLAAGKTITAVMHSDLRVLDPIYTSAYISRDHGYMIFDTLIATDSNFKIQPQMADWKISDDKLTYTFTLRDGLKWHDGAPVTAEDCVASLKRWAAVDGMGQKLMDFTASIEATDAKTITLKLKEPYGLVLDSIGKPSSRVAFMMPKRLAETPPDKPIPEQIGSGPFQVRGVGIPARREIDLRQEHRLRAAQGAGELDCRRQGGEGGPRRVDHHAGRPDRVERAAVGRHRFHGKSRH
ncbi:ABC-type transport system substrate-binding protein [Bradyrhizobium liaoningense]